MLEMAQDRIQQAVTFLKRRQTRAHFANSNVIPKPLAQVLYRIHQKLDSARVCYAESLLDTEKAPKIQQTLDQLAAMGRDVLVTELAPDDIEELFEILSTLSIQIEGGCVELLPHMDTPLVTEVPQKPFVAAPRAVPTKVPYPHKELSPFFEQAKSRGWKVSEKEERRPLFDVEDDDDGFGMSFQLINSVSKSIDELLPDKEMLGVATFPVVSLVGRQLPDSFIQKCTAPGVGYSLYRVFGNYLVVENMYLFGIHRSLLVEEDKGKKKKKKDDEIKIDLGKFPQLLPQLIDEHPDQASILTRLHPIQPAKQKGSHFYTPLLPTAVLCNWSHGIGDWEFLDK